MLKIDITLPFNVDNIKFKLSMISDFEDKKYLFHKKEN